MKKKRPQNLRYIGKKEVLAHSTLKDCWIIINKKVYDVSTFMYEHPGGKMKIMECAGDGKDHWSDFLDAEHSTKAKNMLR